jgi:dipeptidyl aminopeptidase/acylaminoacyl peptidase
MVEIETAPYGSWKSPVTSDLIVSGTVGLGQIVLDGLDVYWNEMRPSEGGRNALVKWSPADGIEEITPAGFDVRTRVHEYGGGAFTVQKGDVYFVNYVNQRLYRQYPHAEAEPVTAAGDLRFADTIIDEPRTRIICVREDHTVRGREAVNCLVAIDLAGSEEQGRVIVSGNDFYSSPRLSPDGKRLAWLTWNHPNMPWDGTELWVAELNDGGDLGNLALVAGGKTESVFQPEWSPDGVLHFVSDRSGWWNLYRWRLGEVEPLCAKAAEFGLPQWVFGMTTYAFESAESIICAYTHHGGWHLARLNTRRKNLSPIEIPYTSVSSLKVASGYALFNAGSPASSTVIARLDLSTGDTEILRRASTLSVEPGYLSVPESIEYATDDGQTAHAYYYRPRNQDFQAPEGEKPPLLVKSHGGPTSTASASLNLGIQYWTSRGFGVLDVNYGGSTGYGRAYRERLNGQWGVVDVKDCINGALALVEKGEVDGNRLAIQGGSAGGYTTLCAITFYDVFSVGASHFGIGDLDIFAKETHKFESRYLDNLVGSYLERRDVYIERSPIKFVDRINCPLILFQGLDDKIVLPNQAEMMFEAVQAKGLPVAYVAFEGEQHGFRQAKNIMRALDGELYFYSKVLGFELAVPVEPIPIDNLPG